MRDDEQEVRLLNTFGFYWHFFMKISEALRSIDNNEGPDTEGEVSYTHFDEHGTVTMGRYQNFGTL